MCGGEWGEIRGSEGAAEQIFFEKVWAAKCSSNQHKEEERPSRDLPAPTLLVLFTLRMIQWEKLYKSFQISLHFWHLSLIFSATQVRVKILVRCSCREGRKTAQTILIPTPHIEQVRLLFVYFSDVHVPFFSTLNPTSLNLFLDFQTFSK